MSLFSYAVPEANQRVVGGVVPDKNPQDDKNEEDNEEEVETEPEEVEQEQSDEQVENEKAEGEPEVEGEGDDDDEPANDFQVAWEMFELASLIYSKHLRTSRQQLADVHLALGDLMLEEEKFEQGTVEYRAALLKTRTSTDQLR